jgi:hypothetical protein
MKPSKNDAGQTVVEFALILTILLILTGGLLDVGRAFYQYNSVANAARFGARYGSVVGGTCSVLLSPPTGADWCSQGSAPVAAGTALPSGSTPAAPCSTPVAGTNTAFWGYNGNWPCQTQGTACPTTYDSSFTGYYTVGNFTSATYPSIAAMLAQRFDTNSTSILSSIPGLNPGFDLTKLKLCIQMTTDGSGNWRHKPGDKVDVFVYYPFQAIGPLFNFASFNLVASSQYIIE